MRLYYEKMTQQGLSSNVNFHAAVEGFLHMGFHVIEVTDVHQIPSDDVESVVLGSISFVHAVLGNLGKTYPTDLDYPETLQPFLGRRVWASTINEF